MTIFVLKSASIRPFTADELAILQSIQKENRANKASDSGVDPKINNKVTKEYPACEHVALKKVHLSVACLKQLASLLMSADVPLAEVEKFLYLLPPHTKDQLVTRIIEEYHKRCAKG